jgi:hypothetical protein
MSCLFIFISTAHASLVSTKPTTCIYSGMDETTLKNAKQSGVSIIMVSITWYDNQPLKNNVDLAHQYGIKIYPSLATAFDGYEDKQSNFAKAHPEYWEKRKDGSLVDNGLQVNLSWGYPEVRAYKVKTITEFVKKSGFDGVLLDYTRYFGNQTGYSNIIVEEFKKKYNRDPFTLATDDPQWLNFRADYVTQFVGELSNSLKTANKDFKVLACVGPDPCECLLNSMNDWKEWLDKGYIDGVVTMIYERDTNNTLKNIAIADKTIAGRVPHIPMIACWGGNLDTPEMLREGSRKCLQAGCSGLAYYRSDAIYELNMWDTIKEVAAWDLNQIRNTPINYMLNAGFENNSENWAMGSAKGAEISTVKSHDGKKSLKLTLSAQPAVRQIMDRGFLPGYKTVHISAWLDISAGDKISNLFMELTINYKNGEENCYRVPITVENQPGWKQWNADVAIKNSDHLNFIIAGITGKAETGELYVDSINLNLTNTKTDSNQFNCPQSNAVVENKNNVNLALGQLVCGSSFWENGFQYEYAVDGNISNADGGKNASWISQRPAKDQWIKIYLPQAYMITKVRMLNSSLQYCYRTRDYKIDISTNDLDYHTIAAGTLPNDDNTWTEIKIVPAAAKYIKFTGLTGYHPDYAVGLKEIEIY